MKRLQIFTCLILSILYILSNTVFIVYADETTISDEDFRSSIGCSEDNFKKLKAIITVLKADGYSDASIAGFVATSWGEATCNPLVEGGFGLCDSYNSQIKPYLDANCSHLVNEAGSCPIGVGHKYCSEWTCTVVAMLLNMESTWSSYSGNIAKYNQNVSANWDTIKNLTMTSGNIRSVAVGANVLKNITNYDTYDKFKNATEPDSAAAAIFLIFGRGAGINYPMGYCNFNTTCRDCKGLVNKAYHYEYFINAFNTKDGGRPEKALIAYKWLTGTTFTPSTSPSGNETTSIDVDADTQKAIASQLALSGYWSEEEVSSFCRLNELDLEDVLSNATIDNLTGNQLEAVNNWSNTIDDMSKEGSLLYIVRITLMISGIVMCIWAVLFYVGFWFDRTNNILDFSVVKILTLGRLQASYSDDDKCTYGLENSDGGKKQVKTINHRIALCITIFTIIVASLIITGNIYRMLRSLIYKILIFLES